MKLVFQHTDLRLNQTNSYWLFDDYLKCIALEVATGARNREAACSCCHIPACGGLSTPRQGRTVVWLTWHSMWHIVLCMLMIQTRRTVVAGFCMQCEESLGRDFSVMMIRVPHRDVRVSHGIHAHYAS
jgi:hypothetical protein